jgi:hypothetical protein
MFQSVFGYDGPARKEQPLDSGLKESPSITLNDKNIDHFLQGSLSGGKIITQSFENARYNERMGKSNLP